MTRRVRFLLGAWFVWMLGPLALTSFTRPFAWWDYLTVLARATPDNQEFGFKIDGIWLHYDFTAPGSIARNYFYNTLENPHVLRPTLSLLYHLQGLAFGGEFWLWYVVKWASLLGCVWLAVRIMQAFDVPEAARWVAAALVLFHPCSFDLMLCNADSWMAVGIVSALGILILHRRFADAPFEVTALGWARYVALVLVWYFTLGVKESALPWALSLVALLQWRGWGKRAWPRMAPFYAALAFWVWRLWMVSRQRLAGRGVEGYPGKVWELARYLPPDAPLHLGGVLLAVLLAWATVRVLRKEPPAVKYLWMLAGAAGTGLVLMSARFHSAPRCDIPVAHLLGIAAGLALAMALRRWPWRGWNVALPAVAACLPFFNAANNYTQALAFQQLFLECADVLRAIEDKIADGYQLALTGEPDVAHESQAAVALYFRQFGAQFYGLQAQPRKIYVLGQGSAPAEPFVLLTSYTPAQLAQGVLPALKPEAIESVEHVERGRYGAIEKLAEFYRKWNCRIGNCGPPSYDYGAPVVSQTPLYYVVTAGRRTPASRMADATKALCEGGVAIEGGCTFEIAQGQWLGRSAEIGRWRGSALVSVEGQIRVERGVVAFGVTNAQGQDLWNTVIPVKDDWQKLPAPGLLEGKGEEYRLFLYVPPPGGARVSIRGVRVGRVEIGRALSPSRRYGAVGR